MIQPVWQIYNQQYIHHYTSHPTATGNEPFLIHLVFLPVPPGKHPTGTMHLHHHYYFQHLQSEHFQFLPRNYMLHYFRTMLTEYLHYITAYPSVFYLNRVYMYNIRYLPCLRQHNFPVYKPTQICFYQTDYISVLQKHSVLFPVFSEGHPSH